MRVSLLWILHTLAVTDSIALELGEISDSTHTAEQDLTGAISALRRIKINEESLILHAGRDDAGRLRWKINEKAVNKIELAKYLEKEILGKEKIKIRDN